MMTRKVTLEFEPDLQSIGRAEETASKGPDEGVLLYTFLLLPVRWRVGGVDLLDTRSIIPGQRRPTVDLPLFHVDRIARAAVELAVHRGYASYSLPGSGESIRFVRIGGHIEATSPFTGETSSAPPAEFEVAFRAFHLSIVSLFRRHIPNLSDHPWLKEREGGLS